MKRDNIILNESIIKTQQKNFSFFPQSDITTDVLDVSTKLNEYSSVFDFNKTIYGMNSFISYVNNLIVLDTNITNNNLGNSQFWWINTWFYTYSSLISLTFMITVIFLIGLILPKTPRGVSTLNVLSAFSIILFLFFLPIPHYNIIKHLVWFDYNLYVYLYIMIGGIFTASFLAINNEITFLKENKHIEYPLLILLVFLFGIVVVASENFIAVFLALEAITLISAVLIGFQRTNNFSTLAGIRYILFSAVPGGALLLGISELYAYTGAFNFADIEKLLMNYNDNYIAETSLNEVGQILYNALDMMLYYNWNAQFKSYVSELINLDVFLKQQSNDFNSLILESTSNSTVLGQIINYEFDNTSKDNLEPTTLSLLGSYILQDNTNYDDNIKVGKYHIYKYISIHAYDNYSLNYLKEVKEVKDYCTFIQEPDYKDPLFNIQDLSKVEAQAIKNDSKYKEFACGPKISFFINFNDDVFRAVEAKKLISHLFTMAEERNLIQKHMSSDEFASEKEIMKHLNPIFYDEFLNKIDLNIKQKLWSHYESRMLHTIAVNEKLTGLSDNDYILNFLKEKKDYLESKLNIIQNELNFNSIKDCKFQTFEDFQKNNTDNFSSYDNYFYSRLINKLNIVNTFIKQLEEGRHVNIHFLDDLGRNKEAQFLSIDLFNKMSGYENFSNINVTNNDLVSIYNHKSENLYSLCQNLIDKLDHFYDVKLSDLKDPSTGVFTDIIDKDKVYYDLVNMGLQKMYPLFIENAPDKKHFFKIEILSKQCTDFCIINNYRSDIFVDLFNKDINFKKGILNLVSVNHSNYNLPTIINISIFLIIFYILFKLTAAPFHIWAPSIYEGAPLPITIFLSIFSKITMIFLLIKLLVFYFYFLYTEWSALLLFSGITSIIVGIYGAISETRIKRFFVYSSMGHVGFMLLGISEGGVHGVLATIIYLMIYTVTVFIGWTILFSSEQKITHINQLSGLSKTNPTLSFILAISMLSMSGIPPLAGFYVKFEILYALVESEYYNVALLALLLTVFSFFYYLRIIKILYFEPVKKFKLQFKLNKTQAFLLALCFLFLVNFSLYFQQPIIYIFKNIIIQSIY